MMAKSPPGFSPRTLVVNADDFGMSIGVNRGIVEAHQNGIVTAASLLVRWPSAEEAVAQSRECPDLSLGLHVDLGEWAFRDDGWTTLYEVVPLHDGDALESEVAQQLQTFRKLTGQNPTHLDSHQHVHRDEPLRSILIKLAEELSIPLRLFTPRINYCGEFYGQTNKGQPLLEELRPESLIRILTRLPPGITEMACHPGFDDELNTMYCRERAFETQTLCDPAVRSAIEALQIELCSFRHCGGKL